jgi:hypothetical protein
MKSDAIIAGGVGGVLGLIWFIALAFMTRAIYLDREFDMPWLMAAHVALVLATGALLAYAALSARLAQRAPCARLFFAAGVTETAALVCGTAFAFVAIGSPPIFLGIFILGPGLVLSASVAAGAYFASKSTAARA